MDLVAVLVVGAIAGWLGSKIFIGSGLGLIGNIVIGILGSFVGNWLLASLGVIFGGILGAILTGTIGAVVILFVINLFVQRR